jgi:hypothetical protein
MYGTPTNPKIESCARRHLSFVNEILDFFFSKLQRDEKVCIYQGKNVLYFLSLLQVLSL